MRGLNKVLIIGTVGRDPEMRYTPSGRPVTSFSVATSRTWTSADGERPKCYVLEMFPYPSGRIHVGHSRNYTMGDVFARYKRAKGFSVLHPMGWDAFGLPAENYAIKTGIHPRVTTEQAVANFRRQIEAVGFAYDWDREVNTTDPATRFSFGAPGKSSGLGVRSATVT